MDTIVVSVVSVTAIGAVLAAVLSVASKLMAVKTDERIARIEECLPGTNCGGCGYPGCSGYAAALVSGSGVNTNLCAPGGAETIKQLSEILGVEAGEAVKKVAVVHCRGSAPSQNKKMDYIGIQSCAASKQLFGGEGACAFGCLGYGDCRPACPSDAICVEGGLARIVAERCTGCGLCAKACPNHLISIEDVSETTVILCKNCEKGAVAMKKCPSACLGCRKCVRECPAGAIIVEDNLARIDYAKCTHCAHCYETCVTHCMQPLYPGRAD